MAWNLDEYEDAASLNRWFQEQFPDGSIIIDREHFDPVNGEVLFRCDLYRTWNDKLPAVRNWARGKRDEYPKNMQRWFVEDTATSAFARAIILLKASAKTATKESMKQVAISHGAQHHKPSATTAKDLPSSFGRIEAEDPLPTVADAASVPLWDDSETVSFLKESLGAAVISDDLSCQHGVMSIREGVSKTGKAWKASFCIAKNKSEKCSETRDKRPLKDGALWWVQSPHGFFEVPRR
jgi:hypothetical protein